MIFIPAYGLDNPGLKQDFTIETGGYEFEVTTISNFDITDYEFNKDEKRLTFFIFSAVSENLSEIVIPTNLINGNFTFYLDYEEIKPKVIITDTISFITVEFPGPGPHKLDIIGTTYLPEFADIAILVLATSMFGLILVKSKLQKLFIKQ